MKIGHYVLAVALRCSSPAGAPPRSRPALSVSVTVLPQRLYLRAMMRQTAQVDMKNDQKSDVFASGIGYSERPRNFS